MSRSPRPANKKGNTTQRSGAARSRQPPLPGERAETPTANAGLPLHAQQRACRPEPRVAAAHPLHVLRCTGDVDLVPAGARSDGCTAVSLELVPPVWAYSSQAAGDSRASLLWLRGEYFCDSELDLWRWPLCKPRPVVLVRVLFPISPGSVIAHVHTVPLELSHVDARVREPDALCPDLADLLLEPLAGKPKPLRIASQAALVLPLRAVIFARLGNARLVPNRLRSSSALAKSGVTIGILGSVRWGEHFRARTDIDQYVSASGSSSVGVTHKKHRHRTSGSSRNAYGKTPVVATDYYQAAIRTRAQRWVTTAKNIRSGQGRL